MQKSLPPGTVNLLFKTELVDGKPRIFWNSPADNATRRTKQQVKGRGEKAVNEETVAAASKKPTLTKDALGSRPAAARQSLAGNRSEDVEAKAPKRGQEDEMVTLTKAQLNAILETVTKAYRPKDDRDESDSESRAYRRKPHTANTDESTDSALGRDIDEEITPRAPSVSKAAASEKRGGARRKEVQQDENIFALLNRAPDMQKAKRVVLAGDTNQRIAGDDDDDPYAPAWKKNVKTVREQQLLDKKRRRQLEVEAQFEGVDVKQLARAGRPPAAPKRLNENDRERERQAKEKEQRAASNSRKQQKSQPARENEQSRLPEVAKQRNAKRLERERDSEDERFEQRQEADEADKRRSKRHKERQQVSDNEDQDQDDGDAEEAARQKQRSTKRRDGKKNEVRIAAPHSAATTQSDASSDTVKAEPEQSAGSRNERSQSEQPVSPRVSLLDKKREKWAAEQKELQRLGVAAYNPYGRPGAGAPLVQPDVVGIENILSPRTVLKEKAAEREDRRPDQSNFMDSVMNSDAVSRAARERERQKWLTELTAQRNGEQERVVSLKQTAALSTSLPSVARGPTPPQDEAQPFVRGAGFAALVDPITRIEQEERRRRQLAHQAAVAAQIEERSRLKQLDRQTKLLADLHDEMRIRQELESQTRAYSDEVARQRAKEQLREARANEVQQRLQQERLLGELQRQLDRTRTQPSHADPPLSSRAVAAAENELRKMKAKLMQVTERDRDGRPFAHSDKAVDASPRSEAAIQASSADVRGALARAERFDADDRAYSRAAGGEKVVAYRAKRDAVVQAKETFDAGVDTSEFDRRDHRGHLGMPLDSNGRNSPDIVYTASRENRRVDREHDRSQARSAHKQPEPQSVTNARRQDKKPPVGKPGRNVSKPIGRKPVDTHPHAACHDGRSGARKPDSPYSESYRKHVEAYKGPQQLADRRKPPAAAVRNRMPDGVVGNVLQDLGWKAKQQQTGNARSSSQPPVARNRLASDGNREAYEKSKYETPVEASRRRVERSPGVGTGRDARIQTVIVSEVPPPPRSPPIPAVRRRVETEQPAAAEPHPRDAEFANEYRYELSEFAARPVAPVPAPRPEPYRDLDSVSPPAVHETQFAPFVRTSEFLDPGHAQSPTAVSREPSGVQRARKAYEKQLDPALRGDELPPPRRDTQLPVYRPLLRGSLVDEADKPAVANAPQKERFLAASADASRLLTEIKRGLVQRQRELEVSMPPVVDSGR